MTTAATAATAAVATVVTTVIAAASAIAIVIRRGGRHFGEAVGVEADGRVAGAGVQRRFAAATADAHAAAHGVLGRAGALIEDAAAGNAGHGAQQAVTGAARVVLLSVHDGSSFRRELGRMAAPSPACYARAAAAVP